MLISGKCATIMQPYIRRLTGSSSTLCRHLSSGYETPGQLLFKRNEKTGIHPVGLCAGTKYLLCDETFDGLDPVVRQAVKSLIAAEMVSRDFTPVIASHNLRELEDFCDSIGLLHQGKAPAHGRHRPGPQQDLQTSVRHPGSAPGAGAPAQSSRDKVRAHRLAPHTHRARGTGGSNAHRRGTGSSLS